MNRADQDVLKGGSIVEVGVPALHHELVERNGTGLVVGHDGTLHAVTTFHLLQQFSVRHT